MTIIIVAIVKEAVHLRKIQSGWNVPLIYMKKVKESYNRIPTGLYSEPCRVTPQATQGIVQD